MTELRKRKRKNDVPIEDLELEEKIRARNELRNELKAKKVNFKREQIKQEYHRKQLYINACKLITFLTAIFITVVHCEKNHLTDLKCHYFGNFFKATLNTECCLAFNNTAIGLQLERFENQPLVEIQVRDFFQQDEINIMIFYGENTEKKLEVVEKIADSSFKYGKNSVNFITLENFAGSEMKNFAQVYNRCRYRLLVIKNGENLKENDVEMASKFQEKYPQSKIIIFFYSRPSDIFKSTAISLFASKSDLPTLKTDLERSVRLTLFNLKNSFFYSSSLLKKMFIVTFLPEI